MIITKQYCQFDGIDDYSIIQNGNKNVIYIGRYARNMP